MQMVGPAIKQTVPYQLLLCVLMRFLSCDQCKSRRIPERQRNLETSLRAEAKNIRQIQGKARDSIVYDQIMNWLHDLDFCSIIFVSCPSFCTHYAATASHLNQTKYFQMVKFPVVCPRVWGATPDNVRTWFSKHCPEFIWKKCMNWAQVQTRDPKDVKWHCYSLPHCAFKLEPLITNWTQNHVKYHFVLKIQAFFKAS